MEMKSKHHSESQRHITVAAEIKIDLQHIGNCAQPSTRTGDSGCCRTKEIIRTSPIVLAIRTFLLKPAMKRRIPFPFPPASAYDYVSASTS